MPPRIEGIEEEDLRRMYDVEEMSQWEIADYYGVDRIVISSRMREYGIDVRQRRCSANANDLRRMYWEEGKNPNEIGNWYGVTRQTIWRIMKEFGIERRNNSEARRRYSLNEDFFEIWTEKSAWLFGWYLGDGCISRDKMLIFDLHKKDKEVLYKFNEAMGANYQVHVHEDWAEKGNRYWYHSRIAYCSQKLVFDLQKLRYDNVPIGLESHFIRGFFESEGSVWWDQKKGLLSNFTQNDKAILEFIHFILKNREGIVKGGGVYKSGNGHQLSFSRCDTIALYHYLYDNCGNLFLRRKKERFEELFEKQLCSLGGYKN
jgi:intein-encoded DNA endonuclease-like protein